MFVFMNKNLFNFALTLSSFLVTTVIFTAKENLLSLDLLFNIYKTIKKNFHNKTFQNFP